MKDAPTIVFDLGNVLVLFDIRITCRGFAQYSPFAVDTIAGKVFGQPSMIDFEAGKISEYGFYQLLCRELEMRMEIEVFKEIWSRMFWENTDVVALLRVLAKNYRVLLLSNTNPVHFEYCQENYPFLHLFDDFILSYEVGHMKPAPAIYKIAFEKAGTTPVIYIDDKLEFASAASENGLIGVYFQSPRQLREDLAGLGVCLDS